ncbi:MAG: metallophosphoesterase [Methylococcales bacterium]
MLLGFILAVWAFVWEPSRLTEKDYTFRLPEWPEACADYRVAVVSDIHAGAPYIGLDKIDSMVAMIQKQKPDLVLLPGDFVIQEVLGGSFIAPEELAQHLKPLLLHTKVYAVLGNHDAWLDSKRVQAAFENAGIPVLEDRAIPVTKNQCQFWLVGLSDYTEGKLEYQEAFSMVPANASSLVFTHNPDVFPDVRKNRFSLLIAGHTHGGQVNLPFIGRAVVPSKYGKRYAIGHVIENDRHLFVTPGIGTSILPVRFGVPPEISYLRLQSIKGNTP